MRWGPLVAALLEIASAAGVRASDGRWFREVSEAWGVRFRHHNGAAGEFFMIETMGSGLVVFDYDGDGDRDLFFVDSGVRTLADGAGSESRLLRNDGPGRFVDVTVASGLRVRGYGMGATAGDVDGDGDLDLYVTAFGPNQLFLNRGDGTFVDGTGAAGVGDSRWGASAAFGDLDRDGDLDLYVTNYLDFRFDDNPVCGQQQKRLRSYCHPDVYEGVQDVLYRNRGDGTFADATLAAGLGGADGKGLGVVLGDLDGDRWPDVYVANDMTANFLFRNRGDGTFEETAVLAGAAYSDRGEPEAGMGVDLGDLDGDGRPDLVVTHLDLQTNALYGNLGAGLFVDRRFVSRLAERSIEKVGFGVAFGDFDQDGLTDVAIANGHIIHNIELWGTGSTYRQPNQLFRNLGRGRFDEVADSGLDLVRSSRGLAVGDLDGDGDLDIAVSNSDDWSEVYENLAATGSWLQVDLAPRSGGPSGIGALLRLRIGATELTREVRTASSYMSQNDLTAHFGMPPGTTPSALDILWPDGRRQRILRPPVSRRLRIRSAALAGVIER